MPTYRWGTATQRRAAAAQQEVVTTWCGQVIGRSHSLKKKVEQIALHQSRNEVTTVSIRGREGSGKTTLARLLAHLLHEDITARIRSRAEPASDYEKSHMEALARGYIVRLLDAEALKNFAEVMERMPALNRILIFDDSSFMGASASKAVTKIKREVTTVRHIAGADIKVVIIFNFHYSRALDPYLRDTNFIVQTGITRAEINNMKELYDTRSGNIARLHDFMSYTRKMSQAGKATIPLDYHQRRRHKSRCVTYRYSDPFRLATWFDGDLLSMFVYPGAGMKAGSPDPMNVRECAICAPRRIDKKTGAAIGADVPMHLPEHSNPAQIIDWLRRQWKHPDAVGRVLRDLFIRRYGYNPIHRDRNLGMEMVSRLEANGITTFDDLVMAYFGPDNAAAKRLLEERSRRPSIPHKQRLYFCQAIGVDGLRPPNTPAIPISEAEKAAPQPDIPEGVPDPDGPDPADSPAPAAPTRAPIPAEKNQDNQAAARAPAPAPAEKESD